MFLKDVPVPTAGLALGVVALGKLMGGYALWAEWVCASVALVLILLVVAKLVLCPSHLRNDLKQPVQAAVFGTFFMTFMQLSTYIVSVSLVAARVVWGIAVLGHFVLMAWFTVERLRAFSLKDVYATWFVCYVGIIVGSVTSPAVAMVQVGQALFWFGFIAYAMLLILVTVRYGKHEVARGAAPTFCIYAAPMSLSLAGYLAVYEVPNVAFVVIVELLAQALFIMVLTQVPKFIRGGFFPSFAAMTFPFVITATALSGCLETVRGSGIFLPLVCDVVLYVEMAIALGMTCFVLGHFCKLFSKNLYTLAKEHRATALSNS